MLLREQMNIIEKHQKETPVKVIPITVAPGLEVYNVLGWPNDISGMIKCDHKQGDKSGYEIYIRGDDPNVRQRFTVAHETGHFILQILFLPSHY